MAIPFDAYDHNRLPLPIVECTMDSFHYVYLECPPDSFKRKAKSRPIIRGPQQPRQDEALVPLSSRPVKRIRQIKMVSTIVMMLSSALCLAILSAPGVARHAVQIGLSEMVQNWNVYEACSSFDPETDALLPKQTREAPTIFVKSFKEWKRRSPSRELDLPTLIATCYEWNNEKIFRMITMCFIVCTFAVFKVIGSISTNY